MSYLALLLLSCAEISALDCVTCAFRLAVCACSSGVEWVVGMPLASTRSPDWVAMEWLSAIAGLASIAALTKPLAVKDVRDFIAVAPLKHTRGKRGLTR